MSKRSIEWGLRLLSCIRPPLIFATHGSDHTVPFLNDGQLDARSDYAIIAEVCTFSFGLKCRKLGIPYALLVQNGYLMYPESDQDDDLLRDVVRDADLILSISADTDRMLLLSFPMLDPKRLVRVRYAVPDHFRARRGRTLGHRRARHQLHAA